MIEQRPRGEALDAHLSAIDREVRVGGDAQAARSCVVDRDLHAALKRTVRAVRLDRRIGDGRQVKRGGRHSDNVPYDSPRVSRPYRRGFALMKSIEARYVSQSSRAAS